MAYLENTILDRQDRHIEGTTAKIEDEYVLLSSCVSFFVKSVGDGGSSGLVDDSEHVQTWKWAGLKFG